MVSTITLTCKRCNHFDTEHFYETVRYCQNIVLPCGHDDYFDDGGERIHNFCDCIGFTIEQIFFKCFRCNKLIKNKNNEVIMNEQIHQQIPIERHYHQGCYY